MCIKFGMRRQCASCEIIPVCGLENHFENDGSEFSASRREVLLECHDLYTFFMDV